MLTILPVLLTALELLVVLALCAHATWRSKVQEVPVRHYLVPAWLIGSTAVMLH